MTDLNTTTETTTKKCGSDPAQQTFDWFEVCRPKLTEKSAHTQLGVHCEEVAEMLDVLVDANSHLAAVDMFHLKNAFRAMNGLANVLKQGHLIIDFNKMDRVEFLDSLCDQMVTAIGVGQQLNMDIIGGFREVAASNNSKLDEDGNAIFDENGKIKKGLKYFKPDLASFI